MFIKLKNKILSILGKNQNSNFKGSLFKSITGTFGISVVNAGLNYIITLMLARFLGAADYGAYIYALTFVGMLQLPALFGLTTLLTREIAAYKTKGNWELATGIYIWCNKVTLINSIILSLSAIYLTWKFSPFLPDGSLQVIWIAISILPIRVMLSTRSATMKGLNHIIKAQIPTTLVRPIILVVLLPIIYICSENRLNGTEAIAIYGISTVCSLALLMYFHQQSLPNELKNAVPKYKSWSWIKNALPLLFISSMYLINFQTDTVMLGAFTDTSSVGIYSIAGRSAGVTGLILSAFNISLAPVFSSLYTSGDIEKLQCLMTESCRSIILASAPVVLGLVFFGNWFMLMFGEEFIQGKTTLSILCWGQFFNIFTGSVALLLVMTGYQFYTAIGVTISALLNVGLNYLLIPIWGIEGAATATVSSNMLWNILMVYFVYKKLKIYATPFGKINFHFMQ